MIVQGEFTFPVAYHGTPVWGPWVRPIAQKTWFGVRGALTLTSPLQTREGAIEVTMTNFSSRLNLEVAQELMDAQLDLGLSGTLYIDGVYYPKCLFLGWETNGPAFLDGSGQHGWTQFGRLRWQRTR